MKAQIVNSTENTARVNFLNKKNEEIYQDLREHVKESRRYKKERIEMLEGNYRELITRGAIDIPVAHIARQMIKDLREHGILDDPDEGISDVWVYGNVNSDCKEHREEDARTTLGKYKDSELSGELPTIIYEIEKLRVSDNAVVDEAHTQLAETEKDLQAKLRLIRDQKEKVEEIGKERRLTFSSHQKNQNITTAGGEAGESKSHEKAQEHIRIWEGIRDNLHDYRPSSEDDEEIAKAIEAENDASEPFADLKYTKSFPEWQQVQITNEIYGKHAASVKHATVLPDGTKRNLTREQVGDSAEEILTKSYKMLMAKPVISKLVEWHKKYVEPHVAQRKADLSGVLSDKA